MKILNERDSFLSNFEVGEHLKEIKRKCNWCFTPEDDEEMKSKDKRNLKKRFTACGLNLEGLTRDILSYMSKSPTESIETKQKFEELVIFLNNFQLMKAEKLQIVNTLPRSMVVLYALVDEFEARFDEETGERIINKIIELYPIEGDDEEEEEGDGEAEVEQAEGEAEEEQIDADEVMQEN